MKPSETAKKPTETGVTLLSCYSFQTTTEVLGGFQHAELQARFGGFRLQLPQELDKVVAETDQIYYNMGLRPTKELFLKRGYAEGDFFIAEAAAATEDFAADPDELESLTDVFEAYRSRLKKKDERQSRTQGLFARWPRRF